MTTDRKSKVLATGSEGSQRCETSRLPHFLENWLEDGGEVIGQTRWPQLYRQED
jgi:hypothetical protein